MVGCLQLSCGNDEFDNVAAITEFISEARNLGCQLVVLPEMVNLIRPEKVRHKVVSEAKSLSLQILCEQALKLRIWIHIGSLALKHGVNFVNRSLLIDPDGNVRARYDKLHLFKANLGAAGVFDEAELYTPGSKAVVAQTSWANYGFSICFDLRFGELYRDMARAGAEILTAPSAFAYETGSAHWDILIRARAIETGCYLLAPAQVGVREGREFWGHSAIVSPWGQILAEARTSAPELLTCRLYAQDVEEARKRLPTIWQQRQVTVDLA